MIREYEPRELEHCAAVFCSAFRAAPWHENWTVQLAETRISELTGTQLSAGFVYEEAGQILGFAAGRVVTYLYGKEYVIDEFCGLSEMQGKGIGSRLLAGIADAVRQHGIVSIVLQTTKGYPSEQFYLKNGFQHSPDMITLYRKLNQ